MKKPLLFFIALFFSFAITSMAQVPNPGFENWTSGDPVGWSTTNVFPVSLINVVQTADSHSGSLALRGEVVNFGGAPIGPIIQSGPGGTGFAISEQYHSFELYYKFTPLGGDRFAVNVALYKSSSVIAQGAVALPATVGNYTYLSVPLNYTTSDVPDLAIIQISINGPESGTDLHVGSDMIIDDLALSLSTGIDNQVKDMNGRCYPNPATDVVNIPFNETISGEVILKVVDTQGKEVMKIAGRPLSAGNRIFQFSVSALSPGLYYYSVDGTNSRYQGKFTVVR